MHDNGTDVPPCTIINCAGPIGRDESANNSSGSEIVTRQESASVSRGLSPSGILFCAHLLLAQEQRQDSQAGRAFVLSRSGFLGI